MLDNFATQGLLGALATTSIIVGWFGSPAVIQNQTVQRTSTWSSELYPEVRLDRAHNIMTLALVKGGDAWKNWIDPPVTIYKNIYVFNITNVDEVKKGAKPILQELGPYVYEQKQPKTEISVNEGNDSVFYRQPVSYFFRHDLTNGSLDDKITVVNIPYVGLTTKALRSGGAFRAIVQEAFSVEFLDVEAFHTLTVDEFLFKGQHLDFFKLLPGKKVNPFGEVFAIYENGSDSGLLEVFTGVKDFAKFGNIASWNKKSSVDFWNDRYCNMINGSDGSLFPPFVTKDKDDIFDDPRESEANQCFCTYRGWFRNDSSACPKRGAYQLESCTREMPMVMSLPHFLDADEEMRMGSIGLNPVREKHETVFTLEPNTGILLRSHKRFQMNIELAPTRKFWHKRTLKNMILPIYWTDEFTELTEAGSELLHRKLRLLGADTITSDR